MNKSDVVDILGKEMDTPFRKADEIVGKLFDCLCKALITGDRIEIRGFGSFQMIKY
jgi:integration host factor subunit beta